MSDQASRASSSRRVVIKVWNAYHHRKHSCNNVSECVDMNGDRKTGQ